MTNESCHYCLKLQDFIFIVKLKRIMDEKIKVYLPSNGECYTTKNKYLTITPITANDENILFSSKLRRDGKVIDTLLKHKIIENIDIKSICKGDTDALVVALYKSSYGNIYRTNVLHNSKINKIEINLDTITNNDFLLDGDENGYFDYVYNNNLLKYKLLTYDDEIGMYNNLNSITEFGDIFKIYIKTVVTSVNGNNDKDFICDFIDNIGYDDMLLFFNYITFNQPSTNISIEINDNFFNNILTCE